MQKNNQKKLFEQLIQEHKGILFKIARIYCQHECDRADLIQEMMIQIWLSLPKYNDAYKLTTWMYRIALNVAISFYRKHSKKTYPNVPLDEQISQLTETNIQDKQDHLNLLEQFIKELKELDKALIFLYLEERSYKEIAEILGITTSNVSTKVGRIKANLKLKFINTQH